jgi:LPXTG-motif cell wall-anchored protein
LVRKILAGASAVAIGSLAALAFATPASATVKNPAVDWTVKCDVKGKVSVAVSLPAGSDPITAKITKRTGEQVGNSMNITAGNTKTWNITETVPLQVHYGSKGSGNFGGSVSEFIWGDAAPGVCKPTIETFNPTCDNLNLGLSIGNPVDAQLTYTFSGGVTDSGELGKGAYAAADEVVGKDIGYTWEYGSGISGSGTAKYVLPKDCAADTPGAVVDPPAKPGKKFHGKGRHTRVVYVPVTPAGNNAGGNGGGSSTADDAGLPVTGTNVALMVAVGLVMASVGGFAVWRARRRRIQFTTNG